MDLKQHPIIQQYIAWNKFGEFLGMDFEIQKQGVVIYEMQISERHLATPMAAHGGSIAGLIDAALGVACLSAVCEEMKVVATVSLSINYLKPAHLHDHITAFAEVIKKGKSLLFVEGKLTNQKGELIATASGAMNAYPVAKISHLAE